MEIIQKVIKREFTVKLNEDELVILNEFFNYNDSMIIKFIKDRMGELEGFIKEKEGISIAFAIRNKLSEIKGEL